MIQEKMPTKIQQCPLYRCCMENFHSPQNCHDTMKRYYVYTFNRCEYYICPVCQNASSGDYHQFYDNHKDHLCDFSNKSKKTIFQSSAIEKNVSIEKNGSNKVKVSLKHVNVTNFSM